MKRDEEKTGTAKGTILGSMLDWGEKGAPSVAEQAAFDQGWRQGAAEVKSPLELGLERQEMEKAASPLIAHDRLAGAVGDLDRQKQAWRLFEAQRYGRGGDKLDPVLRGHLGVK